MLVKSFGISGLVFASMGVNLIATGMLLIYLHRQLNGLPWREWSLPILSLIVGSAVTALIAWVTSWGIARIWQAEGLVFDLVQLSVFTIFGLIVFAIVLAILRIREVNLLFTRLHR